jgi:hypothetical protein
MIRNASSTAAGILSCELAAVDVTSVDPLRTGAVDH